MTDSKKVSYANTFQKLMEYPEKLPQSVELAYETFGEQHTGCPLLILHGFFASSRNWRSIAKQLAKSQRVYVLDMRNHGLSPQHQLMDYPAMAADVVVFMDKMQIDKAHILGHSMGGKIAMWLALHNPQRIAKLIIADIAPVSYVHSFDKTIQALIDLPLNQLSNRKQAEELLAVSILDASYRQFLLQNLIFAEGVYSWRINLTYFFDNAHYIVAFPELANINCFEQPALFLAGEHSEYVRQEAVYHWFPLAMIHEVPGTGHWLHVDAPEQFCQHVVEWINL